MKNLKKTAVTCMAAMTVFCAVGETSLAAASYEAIPSYDDKSVVTDGKTYAVWEASETNKKDTLYQFDASKKNSKEKKIFTVNYSKMGKMYANGTNIVYSKRSGKSTAIYKYTIKTKKAKKLYTIKSDTAVLDGVQGNILYYHTEKNTKMIAYNLKAKQKVKTGKKGSEVTTAANKKVLFLGAYETGKHTNSSNRILYVAAANGKSVKKLTDNAADAVIQNKKIYWAEAVSTGDSEEGEKSVYKLYSCSLSGKNQKCIKEKLTTSVTTEHLSDFRKAIKKYLK